MDNDVVCPKRAPKYHHLPTCCVRMVLVQPGKPDEPVRAELETLCLDANDETTYRYCALSYTWSSDERVFPIILDGTSIRITSKLGKLLQQSRDSLKGEGAAAWWVDQLCINQQDDHDKAQQIPKMRAIYEKAMQVVIWMDLDPGNDLRAFKLIMRLERLKDSKSGDTLENLTTSQILGPSDDDNLRSWAAFGQLMNNNYWRRTWILPEATARLDKCSVFGGDIGSGYGIGSIFWARRVLRELRSRKLPIEYGLMGIGSDIVSRVASFANLRTLFEGEHTDLFDLLYITRRQHASQAEDKIYSMLPFATDVGDYTKNTFLRPSYTHGCSWVYTNLIQWYVLKHRNLNFLGSCTSDKWYTSQALDLDIPSWVPNWTLESYLRPLLKYRDATVSLENRIPLYKACGSFSYSIDVVETPSIDIRPTSLVVSGLRIATVRKTLTPVSDGSFWETDVERSWLDEFDHDAEYTLTGECYRDAFERTVVADTAPSDDGRTVCRPGKMEWWHVNTDSTSNGLSWNDHVKKATSDRKLFFARSSSSPPGCQDHSPGIVQEGCVEPDKDCGSFVIGLGRSDVQVGDQIWALKGGQVLYVLRPHPDNDINQVCDAEHTHGPGPIDRSSLLWLNGTLHPPDDLVSAPAYKFVGECYVHGLMDGEALDFASLRPEERPTLLKNMSSGFEEILIGGKTRFPEADFVEYEHERDWTVY